MSRKVRKGLTEIEINILQLLWREQRPLLRNEILAKLPTHDFNPASLFKVLNNMVDRGLLSVDGKYNKTYLPVMSQEEYAIAQLISLTPNLSPTQRITGLVSCLLHTEEIDLEAVDQLKKILKNYRKELNQQ